MATPGERIPAVTRERLQQGRTFEEYLTYLQSDDNLRREASPGGGARRTDQSAMLRRWYEATELTEAQAQAMQLLAADQRGPRIVLVISEEWSSDCRRDVPVFARLAEAGNLELRIFNRDGEQFSSGPVPSDSPNADLMSAFLNHKPGGPYQSVPIAAFFDADLRYLYHYTEYPALYQKDRIGSALRTPRNDESAEEAAARASDSLQALRESAFFRIWASACATEIITALYMRVMLGVNREA